MSPPFVLQDGKFEATKKPLNLEAEAEGHEHNLGDRSSMSSFQEMKGGPSKGTGDVKAFVLDPNKLKIPRRRPPRSKRFVPFQESQAPERFLSNDEMRCRGGRRQALYECPRTARNNIQQNISSYSQCTHIADPRAEVEVQRNALYSAGGSRATDELEISRTEVIDAGKRRRYACVWREVVQGSQGKTPYSIMVARSDFGIADC
jgi:hypothetical protein